MPRSSRKDPSTVDLRRYGSLAEYNRKRHFGITPEPSGRVGKTTSQLLQFVIQKHAASHLHYDFRLEFAGVMKSWAVPKGPSLDPSVKRLAMAVEDHPIDYNQFEGVIPEGEYGGGTVMIWDKGVWIPEVENVGAALGKGELKFRLEGEKLRGSWALVHTDDRRWLLIKHRDRFATTRDVVIEKAKSVVSRRSMKAISKAAGGTEQQIERATATDPPKGKRAATATVLTFAAAPRARAASDEGSAAKPRAKRSTGSRTKKTTKDTTTARGTRITQRRAAKTRRSR